MPYIEKQQQLPYQPYFRKLVELLSPDSWDRQVAGFIRSLLVGVYGDYDQTRYYRQNEMGGVLFCMQQEWSSRCGEEIWEKEFNQKAIPTELSSAFASLSAELVEVIPVDDETLRSGHLNYFITTLMIEIVKIGLINSRQVPDFVSRIATYIYRTTTRVYEDEAIMKNGDVFPGNFLIESA